MSMHICKRVANRTHRHTHGQTKTQASTQTHTGGRPIEGPAPSSVVPVAGDLGHTAAKRGGRWRGMREREIEREEWIGRRRGANVRVRHTLEKNEGS